MCPVVSVIVPFYNTRRFLAKCLASITAQSLDAFEILCVDDGSTDGSAELVESLSKTDPRIRLLRHGRNRGLGAARNTGVRAARADYIAQIDSDDFIDPTMLEVLHATAIAGDFDVVASGRREVNEQGDVVRTIIPEDRTILVEEAHRDVFAITDPTVCTKLWKRAIFTDNDLYFDEATFYEDLGWTYRALLKSRRIRIFGAAYYNYLLRPGSTTHSMGWRNLADHVANFELLREALEANGVAAAHAESFRNLVRQTLKYHAGKAFELGGPTEDTLHYLRCIFAIKQAYVLPGEFGRSLPDAEAIIHAIEFDPEDARDAALREQGARIEELTALLREMASLSRVPLSLLGPLSRAAIAMGRFGRRPGLVQRGLRLRDLRRQFHRFDPAR